MQKKYLGLYEIYLWDQWTKLHQTDFLYKFAKNANLAKPIETRIIDFSQHYLNNEKLLINHLSDLLETQIKPTLENIIQKYSTSNDGIFEVNENVLKTFQFIYEKNYWIERDIAINQIDSFKTIKGLNTSLKKLDFKFIKDLLNKESDNYEWDFNVADSKVFIHVSQNWNPLFKKQSVILEIELNDEVQKLYYFQLSPFHIVYVIKKTSVFYEKFTKSDFDFINLIFMMLTFQNPHNEYLMIPYKITDSEIVTPLLARINEWKRTNGNS